jgi:hypothetical protein
MRALAFSGEKSFMPLPLPAMSAARTVFVTGLSGAGKSQAIKTFEDLGFYCVEHLPPAALDATLRVLDAGRVGDVAITLRGMVTPCSATAGDDRSDRAYSPG